ncbi:MAG: hypothetical protein CL816_08060 [Coxiellaceae bacterium]|nr:hypothetical protein [Coxiellaceae bacterium]
MHKNTINGFLTFITDNILRELQISLKVLSVQHMSNSLVFLISPPHDTSISSADDTTIQDMSHIAWLTLSNISQNEDMTSLLLYLVIPGLIDQVNKPHPGSHHLIDQFTQEEIVLESLLRNIKMIATQFNIPKSNIIDISLSSYLTPARQDYLKRLFQNTQPPSSIERKPSILPLKEILLNVVPFNELPPLFQLIHEIFDQDSEREHTLPYGTRKKDNIIPIVIEITNRIINLYDCTSVNEAIRQHAEKQCDPDESLNQFITLLNKPRTSVGDIDGSVPYLLGGIFTRQNKVLDSILDNIKKRQHSSYAYLALETIAILEFIKIFKDERVFFTYLNAKGREDSNFIEKGHAFFSQLLNLAYWYRAKEDIQKQYIPYNPFIGDQHRVTKNIERAFSQQLLSMLNGINYHHNQLHFSLLNILNPNSAQHDRFHSKPIQIVPALIENIEIKPSDRTNMLLEIWGDLQDRLKPKKIRLKPFCIQLVEKLKTPEMQAFRDVLLFILKTFKKKIFDDVYNETRVLIRQAHQTKGKIDELILQWFDLFDERIITSDHLLQQLLGKNAYVNIIPITRKVIQDSIKITEQNINSHFIVQFLSQVLKKTHGETIQLIQSRIQLRPPQFRRCLSSMPYNLSPRPWQPPTKTRSSSADHFNPNLMSTRFSPTSPTRLDTFPSIARSSPIFGDGLNTHHKKTHFTIPDDNDPIDRSSEDKKTSTREGFTTDAVHWSHCLAFGLGMAAVIIPILMNGNQPQSSSVKIPSFKR